MSFAPKSAADLIASGLDGTSFADCAIASAPEVSLTRTTHLHLQWKVDFDQKTISGQAIHFMKNQGPNAVNDRIVFDSKALNIAKVELLSAGSAETEKVFVEPLTHEVDLEAAVNASKREPLTFTMGEAHETLGSSLQIQLPEALRATGVKYAIAVTYATTADSSAIQWLSPSQTCGKQHPYLFTQCQAIHCRTLAPVQDSPSNKLTYSAVVTVPHPLVAVMSARGKHQVHHPNGDKQLTSYHFVQPVSIPTYLIALAVGALEKRAIGPRSHIWAEKEVIDAGAHEFAETESFLATAESIVGPYVWGHYDLLLMPPSFPYGGMENPCLTFVTPTLLAGDRSLSNVIAHEIAHSWFGNLVTSQTWEHFWMNEGFTVFLERKICKALHGKKAHDLQVHIGQGALKKSVDLFGADHDFTCMCPHLHGLDPDDAFSSVPYEKGFTFLLYLENLIGGEAIMNPFLRAHCARFAHSTVNSSDWKAFFLDYMTNTAQIDAAILNQIDWDSWYRKPGMPIVTNSLDNSLLDQARALAKDLVSGKTPSADDIKGWGSSQLVSFLESLEGFQKADDPSFTKLLESIDAPYGLSSSRNSEVRFVWYSLCIVQGIQSQFPAACAFVAEQGRMKFTRPLYRLLFNKGGEMGKKLALDTFKANSTTYHAICHKMVSRDLGLA